eukprot:390331_1
MRTAITLLTTCLYLSNTIAKTVEESATGALLSFPTVSDGPLYGKTWDVSPAQFGYQRYGGSLEGILVLPANVSYHEECPRTNSTPEGSEPIGTNPFIHYIKDWFVSPQDISSYFLVIDRMECYFVDKIIHAQLMGASGVIMCDWKEENLFTMWMPEDWEDTIHIPAVLLTNHDCKTLMKHIGVQGWNPTNPENMTYPTPETINWTIATIEWGLPHPDDRVEYELWTSSNDYYGSKFKHHFNTTAIELDLAGDTSFTPHMYLLNGSHWGCDERFNGSNTFPCKHQCTNSGRYCSVDPEYDMSIGLNGMDVIQENLRSLCVWEYDKTSEPGDDIMWWDYSVLWDENCGVYTNSSVNFNADCSWSQMNTLSHDGSLKRYVQKCIATTGGYEYDGGVNTLLRRETRLKYNSSIYAVPMVRVNEFLIHGNIDCELPVTIATCEVLTAICAGFVNGTQPPVCDYTPAPTIAVCDGADKDCAGVCYGPAQIDECGVCLQLSSHEWNSCIGCNGLINTTYDCKGTCGGTYAINPCGYCKDTRHHEFLTFGVDCEGGCSTTLRRDECDNCLEESSTEWNNCLGCDLKPNSNYKLNPCGRCILFTDPNWNNYGKDCTGNCTTVRGMHEIDSCGQCLLPSSTEWDSCIGCDGEDSDYTLNPCGRCISLSDPNWESYGTDCTGNCTTGTTHSVDACGNCLEESSTEWNKCLGCDLKPNSNFKVNPCGRCVLFTDPNWENYGTDCTGNCSTGVRVHYVDECGQCLLPLDELWNACLQPQNTEEAVIQKTEAVITQTETGIERTETVSTKKESQFTMVIIIVCVVVVLIILVAGAIIAALWKKQTAMNRRFESLAATYVPMEDSAQHSNFPLSKAKTTQTSMDTAQGVEQEE